MHIRTLEIFNFRAIKHALLENLTNMVIIAGPNGSGKSCIFDAIRLIKSRYGEYQQNELQQFFAEFQIDYNEQHPEQYLTLFQNRTKPINIKLEIVLDKKEKEFIQTNIHKLLGIKTWKQATHAANSEELDEEFFNDKLQMEVEKVLYELQQESFWGECELKPDSPFFISCTQSAILKLIFSTFKSQNIGIIDYHGAQRIYQREQVGGINLNTQTNEQQLSQHALYNYANKYTNIKSELATSFIRELLAEKAGLDHTSKDKLNDTLKELFKTFFRGKEFLGVKPTEDGKMRFPVKITGKHEHDINELSSGEKEVLFGYLRLHNASHQNSVLLLDEPELHLNPRLIFGLPQFYDKHLGRKFGNQIWLLTHSDTLLREALTRSDFSIFHMQYPRLVKVKENQIVRVRENDEIEQAIMGLVGDLAMYQPRKSIVIFEGGGADEFDITMVKNLFPEFFNSVNPIPGGNKIKVTELRAALEKVNKKSSPKCFSIIDKDSDASITGSHPNVRKWDVYHIENYLLNPQYILSVLSDSQGALLKLKTEDEVMHSLRECAARTLHKLIQMQLSSDVNHQIVSRINTKFDPKDSAVGQLLYKAINDSRKRLEKLFNEQLTIEYLEQTVAEIRSKYEQDLKGNEWLLTFRGRDILNYFVDEHVHGIQYENFRNLIVAKMRDENYKPAGMKKVLNEILHEN